MNVFKKIVEMLRGHDEERDPHKSERQATPLSNRAERRADAARLKVGPWRGESKPAKNPRRRTERALFRALRRDRVRVRRPAHLRPYFASLNRALSEPVVVENEGTVTP